MIQFVRKIQQALNELRSPRNRRVVFFFLCSVEVGVFACFRSRWEALAPMLLILLPIVLLSRDTEPELERDIRLQKKSMQTVAKLRMDGFTELYRQGMMARFEGKPRDPEQPKQWLHGWEDQGPSPVVEVVDGKMQVLFPHLM